MKEKQNKKGISRLFIIIFTAFCAILVILLFSNKVNKINNRQLTSNNPSIDQINQLKEYRSQDLKISFSYPKDWYVYEKDWSILLASYKTRIGENSSPRDSQLKIFIDIYSGGCYTEIEKNLKDPSCGEGGPSVKPNEIKSKEVVQKKNVVFYKYIVAYPTGKQVTFYLLEKIGGDKILQISKKPDLSQFEKEFMDIINSITFP
ncbi:MAG: hypothetical protein A2905_04370 [Candidatus Levybacteria bacterium RIFCSPLOWO2_01_FULL_36_10]|nr:MAG: hypothetical protein A2905_04370 [Candidatus Levybacteria bacterium RIFCSPLOWO2_01_FULL_36_10]